MHVPIVVQLAPGMAKTSRRDRRSNEVNTGHAPLTRSIHTSWCVVICAAKYFDFAVCHIKQTSNPTHNRQLCSKHFAPAHGCKMGMQTAQATERFINIGSAVSVRSCSALHVFASTWQSHVALQVVKST